MAHAHETVTLADLDAALDAITVATGTVIAILGMQANSAELGDEAQFLVIYST